VKICSIEGCGRRAVAKVLCHKHYREIYKTDVCGVYLVRNTVDGKVYIGSSIEMNRRWSNHRGLLRNKKHSNRHLQAAWDKYGENSFEFTTIEACPENVLIAREKAWIGYYGSMNDEKGYNLEDPYRHNHTEETKRRISEARKNNPKCRGHKHTEEAKRRISEAHKGNQWNKGRIPSDETKQKMSESHKGLLRGKKLSAEHKMKLSVAHRGKIISADTRRVLSERTKAYWERKHKEEGTAHE
jgi:group I intron endonuclease